MVTIKEMIEMIDVNKVSDLDVVRLNGLDLKRVEITVTPAGIRYMNLVSEESWGDSDEGE